jgi:Beta-propeller repeat
VTVQTIRAKLPGGFGRRLRSAVWRPWAACAVAVLGCVAIAAPPGSNSHRLAWAGPSPARVAPARSEVLRAYQRLPVSFAPNEGQTDSRVKFMSRGSGYTLFLTEDEAVLSLRRSETNGGEEAPGGFGAAPRERRTTKAEVRFALLGANPAAAVQGTDELPGRTNFLHGNDPARWRTNVPNYAGVRFADIYPGIDLVYDGTRGDLQYDFTVAAGADPGKIRIAVHSRDEATGRLVPSPWRVAANGELVVTSRAGAVRLAKPVVYQTDARGGRRLVRASYARRAAAQGRERYLGFDLGPYDHSRRLVIDPSLSFSTLLGGSDDDEATSIAVNGAGDVYVTGLATSPDFPTTPGALQTTFGGDVDVFVTELNPTGSALIYSTFMGGTGDDEAEGIALDAAGNAYLTGTTTSPDFPGTSGQSPRGYMGGGDAFVTELNAKGSGVVYSVLIGGSSYDIANSIVLDSASNVYITGWTNSADFPVTPGAFQTTYGGGPSDGFALKLNAGGRGVPWSTFIGGGNWEEAYHIALGPFNTVYVAGGTQSKNFPVTRGALQKFLHSTTAAFVVRLKSDGSGAVYSTYLGGSGTSTHPCAACATSVEVDAAGDAYVAGLTWETDFPVTPGVLQPTFRGGYHDAFVSELNPAGNALVFSTYLGGSSDDGVTSLKIDSGGHVFLRGNTYSNNFPVTPGAYQTTYGGFADMFLSVMNPTATKLSYSTYLGGSAEEYCHATEGLALDSNENAYVTGFTASPDFPTTPNAFQTVLNGTYNAFVAKFVLK